MDQGLTDQNRSSDLSLVEKPGFITDYGVLKMETKSCSCHTVLRVLL